MGMILRLFRVSDKDLVKLKQAPELIERFLASRTEPDRGPEFEAMKAEFAKVHGLILPEWESAGEPTPFEAYEFDDDFDVDKMWHGLYFLLTGTADEGVAPACYLLGAPAMADIYIGYTPPLVISPAQTKELSDYLISLDRAAVLSRFDAEQMTKLNIYPQVWDEDENELKEELGGAFDELVAYCRQCADHGLGMISYIA